MRKVLVEEPGLGEVKCILARKKSQDDIII